MSAPVWITISILLGHALLVFLRCLLEELILEERHAQILEWSFSLVLGVCCYFLILAKGTNPWLSLVITVIAGILFFLASFGISFITSKILYWEEHECVGPLFPLVLSVIIFIVFIPTGLGPAIGYPQLFNGLLIVFFLAVSGEIFIQVFKSFILTKFGEEGVAEALEWLLTIILVLSIFIFSIKQGVSRGHALIVSVILTVTIYTESLMLTYIGDRLLGCTDWDLVRFKKNGYLSVTIIISLVVIYIFSFLI